MGNYILNKFETNEVYFIITFDNKCGYM